MSEQLSPAEIEVALADVAATLRADGYELLVEGAGSKLSLRILAGEDACLECLVPPPVLARVVSVALEGTYGPEQIDIAYPLG